jgi:hypothetical protein
MSHSREYGAQSQAAWLIAWLNDARRSPRAQKSYKRLSKLHELLLEASKLASAFQSVESIPKAREHAAFVINAEKLREQVNGVLCFYRLQPYVRELRLSQRRWLMGWAAPGRVTFDARIPDSTIPGFHHRFGEPDAVMRLIELSQSSYLDRVRTCKQCGTWFYAKFAHGRFCKVSCQQENFRTSEEFRKKRREYMREQRRKERETTLRVSGKRS